ncbi:TA system toxin CbtA family protein [Yersinia bercovieri]|uniref:TA system toxin CbtA family protein n=1 Tax=Yersinia bercovieri TaxID=634 RepID=UPI0011AB691D
MCSLLQWQQLVNQLFVKYYGININDTVFCEMNYTKHYWSDCTRPYQAVNEWADKHDLRRLDSIDNPLNETDELSVK